MGECSMLSSRVISPINVNRLSLVFCCVCHSCTRFNLCCCAFGTIILFFYIGCAFDTTYVFFLLSILYLVDILCWVFYTVHNINIRYLDLQTLQAKLHLLSCYLLASL